MNGNYKGIFSHFRLYCFTMMQPYRNISTHLFKGTFIFNKILLQKVSLWIDMFLASYPFKLYKINLVLFSFIINQILFNSYIHNIREFNCCSYIYIYCGGVQVKVGSIFLMISSITIVKRDCYILEDNYHKTMSTWVGQIHLKGM